MRSSSPAALRTALQEEGGQEKERKGAGRVCAAVCEVGVRNGGGETAGGS